ncbi:MAG TPA: MarP family serine protease [Solirubrobacterales bacterium]|nr:MarP family serine protease [Solirubrobacterales bacterium]
MNFVDLIIAVFAVAFAAIGYERGLLASALPLAGFVLGAIIGGRLGPALLTQGGESPYAPLVTVVCGLLLGTVLAVVMEGVAEAVRLRFLPRGGVIGQVDGLAGAVLLGALGLLLAWAFGAAALNVPGPERGLREALQRSRILGALNDALPPSGPILNLLRHVDPVPSVTGPEAKVGAPQPAIAHGPEVRRAGGSVVKILGSACGLGIEGSGWVAGQGLVVTNAHVVAGEDDTTVTTRGGDQLDAAAVHYDPHDDLAILRVSGLDLRPLDLAPEESAGVGGAVLGYPENGPFRVAPARLGSTETVISQDSYGRGPVQREMMPFRGEVRSGNSGGPVVDGSGDVLTTVFAAAKDNGPPGGLGVPNEVVGSALSGPLRPSGTGPCAA